MSPVFQKWKPANQFGNDVQQTRGPRDIGRVQTDEGNNENCSRGMDKSQVGGGV